MKKTQKKITIAHNYRVNSFTTVFSVDGDYIRHSIRSARIRVE